MIPIPQTQTIHGPGCTRCDAVLYCTTDPPTDCHLCNDYRRDGHGTYTTTDLPPNTGQNTPTPEAPRIYSNHDCLGCGRRARCPFSGCELREVNYCVSCTHVHECTNCGDRVPAHVAMEEGAGHFRVERNRCICSDAYRVISCPACSAALAPCENCGHKFRRGQCPRCNRWRLTEEDLEAMGDEQVRTTRDMEGGD